MIHELLDPGANAAIQERVIRSAVLIIGLAITGWLANRVRLRTGRSMLARVTKAALAVAMLTVGVAVAWGLLIVWEVSTEEYIGDPVLLGTRLAVTVGLIVGIYVVTGLFKRLIYDLTEDRASISRHQTELAFRITQVSLYALALIVAFGLWDVNLGGLLVGAGFLGIVVGLAARQTLGALLAGFVLMFSRPFEIGDWIEVGDREGIVTEISIVNTRIQTFDGEYAMVPNDVVGSTEIINRTRMGRLRLSIEVGVDYDTDIDRAMEVATEAMKDLDEVLTVPQPSVVLTEFDTSSIGLRLRCWIDKPTARRKWRAQTAIIRAVKAAFDREGIKIPFPQRELSGREETGGFRLATDPEAPTDPDGSSEEQ